MTTELENPIVNLTITGLGGTRFEPGTPKPGDVLSRLPDLISSFKCEPWRIRWRFDPMLKGPTSLDTFSEIGGKMSELGVSTCTFSFPSYRSLKGDLGPQFEKSGIPRWQLHERGEFLSDMSRAARNLGITLFSCAQPENTKTADPIEPAQCIPFDVLARGFPAKELLVLSKDYSQRTHCTCIESEDIGDYELDPCFGGCVYCYSKARV